jgi:protein-disulfide isomerase
MRIVVRFAGLVVCLLAMLSSNSGAAGSGKTLGKPDAPIRIELFSDYQCPSCKIFHDTTLKQLIAEYVNTGKVYLVVREFPLVTIHSHAREAASIACAADMIGKYGQVADQLFLTQQKWEADGDVAGAACRVLSPAEAKKVTELAKTPEIAQRVESEMRLGQNEKVNGTPTMIITRMIRRYPISGPVSFAVLSKFLDSLLS